MDWHRGQMGARTWRGPGFAFARSGHARVMGIVNVTPDSFSGDGTLGRDPVARALDLVRRGADILDVGGESTRPGSDPVSADEEAARVVPVIQAIRERTDVPVSVDTYKASVAADAIGAGAAIVNDVSGFRFDPAMPKVVADAGAACVLMHILGEPKTMQTDPTYEDLIGEVRAYLAESIAIAEAAGIDRERIAVDPGIGFGKTFDHNLTLLARLGEFADLGCAILIGPSRKAFLGAILGGAPPDERTPGTAAAVACGIAAGADVVRVHDVGFISGCARVASAIRAESVEAVDGA